MWVENQGSLSAMLFEVLRRNTSRDITYKILDIQADPYLPLELHLPSLSVAHNCEVTLVFFLFLTRSKLVYVLRVLYLFSLSGLSIFRSTYD